MIFDMFNIFYPILPDTCDKPPTIYAILNSIVNFGKEKEDQIKITELAKNGRTTIFDFDYPLSNNINKADFETIILNKFLMRRIGFETITAFKIALNVKLNEIMPNYNKIFDSFFNWDIFNDGEEVTRNTIDNSNGSTTNSINTKLDSKTNNNLTNIDDLRRSNLPQSQIDNVKNGSYLTEYQYNTTTNKNDITLNDITSSDSQSSNTNKSITDELIKRTPSDKMSIYRDFIEYKNSIYTMIFKDLEILFFGIE